MRQKHALEVKMKINISVGQDEFLTGYTNIDPISKPEGLAVDIRNLDSVASDSECTEIIAVDVLDFLDISRSRKSRRSRKCLKML